jgi:hypothetical protein
MVTVLAAFLVFQAPSVDPLALARARELAEPGKGFTLCSEMVLTRVKR